jgi:hypothetical protein
MDGGSADHSGAVICRLAGAFVNCSTIAYTIARNDDGSARQRCTSAGAPLHAPCRRPKRHFSHLDWYRHASSRISVSSDALRAMRAVPLEL